MAWRVAYLAAEGVPGGLVVLVGVFARGEGVGAEGGRRGAGLTIRYDRRGGYGIVITVGHNYEVSHRSVRLFVTLARNERHTVKANFLM